MLSQLVCFLVLWPALILRFGLFAPRPTRVRRPLRRQWGAVACVAGRLFAVRLQVALVPIGGAR